MSINGNPYFQRVALPVTLSDLLAARETAIRLHNDARKLMQQAEEELRKCGAMMSPGMRFERDADRCAIELDQGMWRRAFDLTGFKQLMDAEAVAAFERSLSPKPPEFTEANIRSTFIDLHQQAGHMFRRGIVNVFRRLSPDYRTNAAEPFKVGRKAIMGYMIVPSYRSGLVINYGLPSDRINDIDRVIKTLDGKKFSPRELESAMNTAFGQRQPFEDDYYRAKAFKNGNLHIEFKRSDLLDLLNEEIAEHYGAALATDKT